MVLNFSILGFFCYNFYLVYVERKLVEVNFWSYIAPTILGLQGVLLVSLGPLVLLTYRRTSLFTTILHRLDPLSLQLYHRYIQSIARWYATIPPYIFQDNEIALPRLLSIKYIPYSEIEQVVFTRSKRGRGLAVYLMKITTVNHQVYTASFYQIAQAQFAMTTFNEKCYRIKVINSI
jgi:hypothetical protein